MKQRHDNFVHINVMSLNTCYSIFLQTRWQNVSEMPTGQQLPTQIFIFLYLISIASLTLDPPIPGTKGPKVIFKSFKRTAVLLTANSWLSIVWIFKKQEGKKQSLPSVVDSFSNKLLSIKWKSELFLLADLFLTLFLLADLFRQSPQVEQIRQILDGVKDVTRGDFVSVIAEYRRSVVSHGNAAVFLLYSIQDPKVRDTATLTRWKEALSKILLQNKLFFIIIVQGFIHHFFNSYFKYVQLLLRSIHFNYYFNQLCSIITSIHLLQLLIQ